MHPRLLVAVAAAIVVPIVAGAQASADTLSLQGKSFVLLSVGLTGSNQAINSPGGQTASSSSSATLDFTHFLRPSVAFEIAATARGVNAFNDFSDSRVTATSALLFGANWAPEALALSTGVRPYASVLVGPYFNSTARNVQASQTATTDVAPGARLGLGVNWFVARHFSLQLEGDYHAVGKFDHPELVERKPNGFALTAGFAIGWGGR